MTRSTTKRGLMARLAEGPVVCAEGYLFELERRGYLQAGTFVPEVVLDHPEVLLGLHRELVHAGSDVVEAFTYYGHREKLRLIGKEDLLEPLNRRALEIAQAAAAEADGEPPLVAGNLSNSNRYVPGDAAAEATIRAMCAEQVRWAVEEGADYLVGETFYHAGEALLALEVMAEAGLPTVVTLAQPAQGPLLDDVPVDEASRRLEQAGADVVGLNCFRGPATMLPALRAIRAAVSVPVAGLPVPYRTTAAAPTFFRLEDPAAASLPDGRAFPLALEPFLCTRFEVAAFADEARAAGIDYLGLCCGAAPHTIRALAEAVGRTPPASRYAPDLTRHFAFGDDPSLDAAGRAAAGRL